MHHLLPMYHVLFEVRIKLAISRVFVISFFTSLCIRNALDLV